MIKKIINLKNDRTLSVWDSEQKSKQPVIFLHGLTGNGYQLQHYYNFLSHEFRTIAIDFRGRGDSGQTATPSSIAQHCNDVIDLIEALELKRVVLVGYSMGGFIAAQVASLISVDKIVLLDGCALMSDHQDGIVRPSFGRLNTEYESEEDYVSKVVSNYQNMGVKDSEDLRRAVSYEVKAKDAVWVSKSVADSIVEDWNSFYVYDVEKVCRAIDVPVLLVEASGSIGDFGPLFYKESYETTEQHLKDVEIFETDANHYTLVFNPQDEINEKIEEFLK